MVLQFLFNKYLQYEKSHGDEEKIEYVKQKAMDYVNSVAWYQLFLSHEGDKFPDSDCYPNYLSTLYKRNEVIVSYRHHDTTVSTTTLAMLFQLFEEAIWQDVEGYHCIDGEGTLDRCQK